jgi:hypothetical protein
MIISAQLNESDLRRGSIVPTRDLPKMVRHALLQRTFNSVDDRGYVKRPAGNLVPGVRLEQFEGDLREGDGNELDGKFCAAHSSSALAVNCLAWFNEPDRFALLPLLDSQGAESVRFERKFPIFRGGTPPNLDVVIDRASELIAIESKLTEHLVKKQPKFTAAYERLAPPALAESCWWEVYQKAKTGASGYLDVAQLLKHYFGLRKHQQGLKAPKPIRFLYLFWEPLNWADIEVCRQHRKECLALAEATAASEIPFRWKAYPDLWQQWTESPAVSQHAKDLQARYGVELPWAKECERCGEPLVQLVLHVVPGNCWKCGAGMKIAFIDCEGTMVHPEQMTAAEIAKAQEMGACLQINHSQTCGADYLSNTCPSCGLLTGSHYLENFYHEANETNGVNLGPTCLNCWQEEHDPDEPTAAPNT